MKGTIYDFFKKVSIIAIMACVFFTSNICSARISVEADNWSDTISYRSYKTIGSFGVWQYNFIKNIRPDETANYYLWLELNFPNHSNLAPRYLTGKVVDLVVDGKTYPVNKVINEWHPRIFSQFTLAENHSAWYKFTQEGIDAISKSKGDIVMKVYMPDATKNTVITCNGSNRDEIHVIIGCKFSDYLTDVNDKLPKNQD